MKTYRYKVLEHNTVKSILSTETEITPEYFWFDSNSDLKCAKNIKRREVIERRAVASGGQGAMLPPQIPFTPRQP